MIKILPFTNFLTVPSGYFNKTSYSGFIESLTTWSFSDSTGESDKFINPLSASINTSNVANTADEVVFSRISAFTS